ncbi:MAG: NUDIX hydrolase [Oscillospiraceae bacterium]
MTLYEQLASYRPCCEQEESDRALMLRYLREFPDTILTRDNPMAHFTASAWVTTPGRDKVLLAYHNIYRSWAWTGGHADGESDLLGVALREVREETGLKNLRPVGNDIWSLEILSVAAHRRRGQFVSAHLHLNATFLLEAEESEPLRVRPEENSAVGWFPAEEVVERSTEPEMQVVYRKLLAKMGK